MHEKFVVGLMSGTSADGIDSCVIKINRDFSFKFIDGLVFQYPENIKNKIFEVFTGKTTLEEICWLNFVLGEYFAEAALQVIKRAGMRPENVDLIGSHGQTVYHRPQEDRINGISKKSTLQIGDGSIIAERTGIDTISDFRPADIAVGGEGAPLVCFADEILFKSEKISRAIQNIGGIGNVTVVSPDVETFAFDTGPGNVFIDYYVNKFFSKPFDKDGKIAVRGKVDKPWLEKLLDDPYYKKSPPKTTGREYFSTQYMEEKLKTAPDNKFDVVATLTALTAGSIYKAYKDFVFPKVKIDELILGGGGSYNPELVKHLRSNFGKEIKILKHEDFEIPGKYKEAIAFAMLAYANYYKIPNNVPSCTGAKKKKILGKLSLA